MKATSPQSFFHRYQSVITIVLCMGFVVTLSILFFLKQSLRLDEAQSIWQTSHSVAKIFNIVAQDVHVPLYHLILHFWLKLFGSSVPVARSLSLLFFVLSIPALFKLGELIYGKNVAMLTVILYSISPFMNWYGNEARMYTLFTLLVILNFYFFIRLYKDRDTERQSNAWFWYIVTTLLGIYSHYFFFFVLVSEVFFYLTHRSLFPVYALKRFLLTVGLVIVTFVPWVLYVTHLHSLSNSAPQLEIPNSVDIFNTFSQFLFGFQINYVNTILVSLWPITVLLGFLALKNRQKLSVDTAFMIICFIGPNILAYIVSVYVIPLYLSRYLILTVPPMYLLLSWLAMSYSTSIRRVVVAILVSVMLATLVAEIVMIQTPVKEDYHSVTSYIQSHAANDDVIVVSAPFTVYPIEYYYNGPVPIYTLPIWDRGNYGAIPAFDAKTLPQQVQTVTNGSNDVWVILSYDQGYESNIKNYFDQHYQRLLAQNFSPDLNLYEYKIRY